jgi:hypothetical protein
MQFPVLSVGIGPRTHCMRPFYSVPTIDYLDVEFQNSIDTGIDYNMHFDLIDYAIRWCECENDNDCKILLQTISSEKDIFLGEFIKAILKINNISSEMEKISEYLGDIEFLDTLKQIPPLTLKYLATNQSLYI